MKPIQCPHCKQTFNIDEADYACLLSQVKSEEYHHELEEAERRLEEKYQSDLKLAKKEASEESAKTIAELQSRLTVLEASTQSKIKEAENAKEKEILALEGKLRTLNAESELKAKSQQDLYKLELRQKDEEIERLRDMKARMSTKMVGETLEQHCLNSFNAIRMGAFPNAKFGKDNDVSSSGSKGDFIYRDFEDGVEYISIMFEMKNEMDTTSTKHKNEDFFKELDKDRNEKKCEYAVLVSLLEPDSELYNGGIVDVSYAYSKMYVIRPQMFIPMITILRNAALNNVKTKKDLEEYKNRNIDITHFEERMDEFQKSFAYNYDLASKKYSSAIEEIDKTIDHLKKVRDNLEGVNRNLKLANDKAQDLSIKKLTKGNPTMKEKFDQLHEKVVDNTFEDDD